MIDNKHESNHHLLLADFLVESSADSKVVVGMEVPATFGNAFIDSRKCNDGDLFFALPGEHRHGYEFVADVVAKGASAVVGLDYVGNETGPWGKASDETLSRVIQVPNVEAALQEWAKQHRLRLNPKVLAITGSNGKTTTKEIVAALLNEITQTPKAILATEGNLNNHLGVPLTLLRLTSQHRYAVIEMGMNHRFEIQSYCRWAMPDIAYITNIGTAHIGELGSKDEIARAKGEVYKGLKSDGVAIVNSNDSLCVRQAEEFGGASLFVRLLDTAEVSDFNATKNEPGTFEGRQGLIAKHSRGELQLYSPSSTEVDWGIPAPAETRAHLGNWLGAFGVLQACGFDLQEICDAAPKVKIENSGRAEVLTLDHERNVRVVNDTYNANWDSFEVGFEQILNGEAFAGSKLWIMLGDFLELGSFEDEVVFRIIEKVKNESRVTHLGCCGPMMRKVSDAFSKSVTSNLKSYWAEDSRKLAEWAKRQDVPAQTTILVKGSRGSKMENVVSAFLEA